MLAALAAGCAPSPAPLSVPPATRAVVVAPHPDDETLAAGGLVQRILRTGGTVRVIVLTLGDGYLEAAARLSGHSEPSQADYRALGAARTQETRDAAALLGVRELVLLGAPDDGLGALWAQPDVPLVSPATGAGPFSGRALLGSLRAAIEDGSPTLVVAPDPRDHHADHAAAGRFTLAAVADFRSAPTILTYLVHDTVWPPPLANGRDMPAPGAGYEDTRWVDFRLTSDELAVKRSALAAYRTQWPIMGGLLERFLRDNEVFATR